MGREIVISPVRFSQAFFKKADFACKVIEALKEDDIPLSRLTDEGLQEYVDNKTYFTDTAQALNSIDEVFSATGPKRKDFRPIIDNDMKLVLKELNEGLFELLANAIDISLGFEANPKLIVEKTKTHEYHMGFDKDYPQTWPVRSAFEFNTIRDDLAILNKVDTLNRGELIDEHGKIPSLTTFNTLTQTYHTRSSSHALGFQYWELNDNTVLPVAWGMGVKSGAGNKYNYPGSLGSNVYTPIINKIKIYKASKRAFTTTNLNNTSILIPIQIKEGGAKKLEVYLGGDWDPRAYCRNYNIIYPPRLEGFTESIETGIERDIG